MSRVREVVPPAMAGVRLDRGVSMLADLPRARAARLIADGIVAVNGVPTTSRSRRLEDGDVVELERPEDPDAGLEADAGVHVEVVYEDDQLIVVSKPSGVAVHPGAGLSQGTLVQGLLARYPELAAVGESERPGIVHRLDRGTSGLLVVARTQEAYRSLVDQLANRTAGREYDALVRGEIGEDAGLVDAPIARSRREPTRMAVSSDGREARTRFEVVARFAQPEPATRVRCTLETGRTHQVRVHLAAIGHPVMGDEKYGGARPGLAGERMFLHACSLDLDRPVTGERLRFTSELPADLLGVLERFS